MGEVHWVDPANLLQVYGPHQPFPLPHIDPRVIAAAKGVKDDGWRVTSIYRPNEGHHSQGIAFDIATMEYQRGTYGPRTAKATLKALLAAGHSGPWLVVAEVDHIHIQLNRINAYGWQPYRGKLYLTRL